MFGVSLFRGGYAVTATEEIVDDWHDFVDLCTNPLIGPKNGDYFVRGFCDGEREDKNMRGPFLIIIDGDQLLSDGSTCCQPQPVHAALKTKNITHVIYNSYSNDLANNRHKWRVCIPCPDIEGSDSLRQGVEEVISLLHAVGLPIRNVRENAVLSQPWFTPRASEASIDDFYCASHNGQEYRLSGIQPIATARYDAEYVEKAGRASGGCFSWDYVIGQFQAGTLHQGLKAACGWLIFTTNWADVQIKQHLAAIVRATCPDAAKVSRACEGKELDSLIKYCREKSGMPDAPETVNWKQHHLTALELRDKDFPPIKWAVDKIIPEGLTVLAGAPKAGKSIMAVDICSAIASGVEAFGSRACVRGAAVYFCLEDPARLVKDRIREQCDRWPETFHLVSAGLPTIGKEFFSIMDEVVMLWPETRIIVIDVLQLVIPEKKNGVSDYDHYYAAMDPLHRWSLKNSVAVVCITHRKKGVAANGDNPFDGIIGSVAIQGTTDAMLMLERNHAKGTICDPSLADGFLTIVGKEVGNEKFSLDFDHEAKRWSIRPEHKPEDTTTNLNWICIQDALKRGRMRTAQIVEATQINHATVKSCLQRMKSKNIVAYSDHLWSLIGKEYENDKW